MVIGKELPANKAATMGFELVGLLADGISTVTAESGTVWQSGKFWVAYLLHGSAVFPSKLVHALVDGRSETEVRLYGFN